MQKQHPFNCYFFLKIKDENNNNNNDDDDDKPKDNQTENQKLYPVQKLKLK